MQSLSSLFGESPFEAVVAHARKVHACIQLLQPVTDAILAGDMPRLKTLQDQMSQTEYEADQLKDEARQQLSRRLMLSVRREDLMQFLRQLDRMCDDAENFAVVATFRPLDLPETLKQPFRDLVDKVIQLSEALLGLAEHLATLQKEAFEGPNAEAVLKKVEAVCLMEWESDKLSRRMARLYYAMPEVDAVIIILLEKLCTALTGIADHAENVGKSLRLMVLRK